MQPISPEMMAVVEAIKHANQHAIQQAVAAGKLTAPPDTTIPAWIGTVALFIVAAELMYATYRLWSASPRPNLTRWHLIYGLAIAGIASALPPVLRLVEVSREVHEAFAWWFAGSAVALMVSYTCGMSRAVREQIEREQALDRVLKLANDERHNIRLIREGQLAGVAHG
jgi:hypothetical protein